MRAISGLRRGGIIDRLAGYRVERQQHENNVLARLI